MKILLPLAFSALLGANALAGSPVLTQGDSKKTVMEPAVVADPLFTFRSTSSYVGESDFIRGKNASGDALHNDIELGYRIPLGWSFLPMSDTGNWYLRLGARYTRMDFGNEGGLPIPNTLQSAAGVIGLEYLRNGQIGFLFQSRPGVYFEHDVSSRNFDAPTIAFAVLPITDTFYGVVGATAAVLREYPVLPVLGFYWKPSERWSVLASVPEPRITYKPFEQVSFYAGGELAGGSFRVDGNDGSNPSLNHAVLTYSEYRVGGGVTWETKNCAIEIGGGYAIQRKFDYFRAEKGYETDNGAPYVRVELRSAF